jgi:hypothetical protein
MESYIPRNCVSDWIVVDDLSMSLQRLGGRRRLGSRPGGLGFAVALLAVVAQLAWAASVPQPVLQLLSFAPICHTDSTGTAPGRTGRQVPLRAVSPQCLALAMPLPLAAGAPLVPPPSGTIQRAPLAQRPATVPPALFPLAAAPRGPPTSLT